MRRAIAPSRLARLATHLQLHHTRPIATKSPTTTTGKMSTSSSSPPPAAAPWRSLFLSHLEGMESAEFTLSTLRRASSPSAAFPSSRAAPTRHMERRSSILAAPVYYPRARICICRGLWAHLPANPKNEAPLNPEGVWESDLITFTTDARMDKMEELVSGIR